MIIVYCYKSKFDDGRIKLSRLSYSVYVCLPLMSYTSKISKYKMWCDLSVLSNLLFQAHRDIKQRAKLKYNYGSHCGSLCGSMDPFQEITTKDTDSDIDRACWVDITCCMWGRYSIWVRIPTYWTCNEAHNSYITSCSPVKAMAAQKFVYKYNQVTELYIMTLN